MYRRVRIPLFVGSLLLLAFAAFTWARDVTGTHLLNLTYEVEEPQSEREADERAARDAEMAYAARMRIDGFNLLKNGDFENALIRFDQAAQLDPRTDESSEHVHKARRTIAENLGLSEADPHPAAKSAP